MLYKTNEDVLINSNQIVIFDPTFREEKCIIRNVELGTWNLFKTFKEDLTIESLVFSNIESIEELILERFKFDSIILVDSRQFVLCDKDFFKKNNEEKNLFIEYFEKAFESQTKSKLSETILEKKHTITSLVNETTESIIIETCKTNKKINAIKINLN